MTASGSVSDYDQAAQDQIKSAFAASIGVDADSIELTVSDAGGKVRSPTVALLPASRLPPPPSLSRRPQTFRPSDRHFCSPRSVAPS